MLFHSHYFLVSVFIFHRIQSQFSLHFPPPFQFLFVNPNKWGRGITTIWIASHTGCLRKLGYEVKLFDCTFYKDWTDLEIELNTVNNQFKKTDYLKKINWNKNNVIQDLKNFSYIFSKKEIFELETYSV